MKNTSIRPKGGFVMVKVTRVILAVGSIAVLAMAVDAGAESARVRCRVKGARTQVSVDGRGLGAGRYTATLDSSTDAGGVVTSATAIRVVPPANEAEFDFDSKANDIAAGATALPRHFVTVPGSVNWQLLRNGAAILAGTQVCVAK
jgi:hypothetical protein